MTDEYHDEHEFVTHGELERILRPIREGIEALNMSEQDLETAQAAEAAAVATLTTDEVKTVGDLQAEITALQAQVASGTNVTAEQLQSAVDKANAVATAVGTVNTALEAADTTQPAPVENPTPTEPPATTEPPVSTEPTTEPTQAPAEEPAPPFPPAS